MTLIKSHPLPGPQFPAHPRRALEAEQRKAQGHTAKSGLNGDLRSSVLALRERDNETNAWLGTVPGTQ